MAVPERLQRVAVIGNGIMGHGISQVFAGGGKDVVMIGRNEPGLRAARARIGDSLQLFQRHALLSQQEAEAALARVSTSTSLLDAAGADLVVEAVPEDTELKLAIFGKLDGICPPRAVLASSCGRGQGDRRLHRQQAPVRSPPGSARPVVGRGRIGGSH